MRVNEKTNNLVMAAMMTCLITVSTMLFKVPIPGTQGYVHLGDAMIFLGVFILGLRNGAIAAAVGSALGDILGGFAVWAPWTVVIKGGMATVAAIFIIYAARHCHSAANAFVVQLLGMTLGGVLLTVGYYAAEGIMYGNWAAALLGVPWNIAQFAVGMVIACALAAALCQTPAKKIFTYRIALNKKEAHGAH